ncbi:uncharacterized protein LOC129724665 [Wyeomyia smithii]|uniref:uncharacterized protein LOC129724665 n=1 Tax=Wyeomyia smithii TaxID=174621 RepID=UPI0024681E14|nr:uncharacterized protein LOC129724665 [Wyeomyia smithii]
MMPHHVLIWSVGFFCVCLLLYICTFRSYLKGVKKPILQLSNTVPVASINPKARNATIFVIDVETGLCCHQTDDYLKNPTLNLDAITKAGKPKPAGREAMSVDVLSGRLLSEEERNWFTI